MRSRRPRRLTPTPLGMLLLPLAWAAGLMMTTASPCAGQASVLPDAPAAPTTRGAEAPPMSEEVTEDQLDRIIIGLSSAAPRTRELSQLQVRNLPAGAYASVRERFDPEGYDPETRAGLARAMKLLAVRYGKHERMRKDLEWLGRQTTAAYESSGAHDPRWDAAARAALAALGAPRRRRDDADEDADRLAAFRAAVVDAGCTDPVVVTYYTAYQVNGRSVDPATVAKAKGNKNAPPPRPDLDAGTAERIRAAAEAMRQPGGAAAAYPAWLRCVADQSYARVLLLTNGDRNVARRWLNASLDQLPDALRTAGFPVDPQMNLVYCQHELEAALDAADPARGKVRAFNRLYPVYAAIAPDAPGPLLFKGRVYVQLAFEAHALAAEEGRDAPRAAKALAERLAVAREALEAAWQLDPADWRSPNEMISVAMGLSGDRDEMEKWFKRAMDADPDDADACARKLYYLAPRFNGSEAEMLEFGRQCLATQNYRGRVAMTLVRSHQAAADLTGDAAGYYRRPDVWPDVRAAYEGCLAVFPDSAHDRSAYAKLAFACGEYAEAKRQCDAAGERADVNVWGGQTAADAFRLEAARRARPDYAPPRDRRAVVDPALAKALDDALATANGRGNLGAGGPLTAVAQQFQAMRRGTESGKPAWNRVTLNAAGKGLDCVRFRTPAGAARDMRWAFSMGQGKLVSWYIIRADGQPMNGFTEFYPVNGLSNFLSPGDGGKHDSYIQQLPAASLQPDVEYLLWFRIRGADPVRASVALNFVPPAAKPAEWNALLKDLGLH